MLAYAEFEQLRARSEVFSGLFAAQKGVRPRRVTCSSKWYWSAARCARVQLVSGEFFVLGVLGAGTWQGARAEDQGAGSQSARSHSRGDVLAAWSSRSTKALSDRPVRIGGRYIPYRRDRARGFHGIEVGAGHRHLGPAHDAVRRWCPGAITLTPPRHKPLAAGGGPPETWHFPESGASVRQRDAG